MSGGIVGGKTRPGGRQCGRKSVVGGGEEKPNSPLPAMAGAVAAAASPKEKMIAGGRSGRGWNRSEVSRRWVSNGARVLALSE